MTFLLPIGLAALLAVPLIYLIHWLRGSRRVVRVPALFLWTDLPRSASGRARRRIPPFSLLLLLQMLAAVLLAFALARFANPSQPPRHVALVVDASASMQATDVSPSRFESGRKQALDRLSTLSTADEVSVIRAGKDATLQASGAPDSVRAALNSVQPGVSGAAIREALALASTQLRLTPDLHGEIIVVTDLAWPPLASVGELAAPVQILAVGGGAENQAISSLQVRIDPSGHGQTAFIEVSNASDRAVRAPIRLTADNAPLDQREVDVPARGRTRLSLPLPLEAHAINVRLLGRDALALDDSADVISLGGAPRDVVLVGRPSTLLRRALESLPFVRLRVDETLPASRNAPLGGADLTVLAGTLPSQLPQGPLLLVDPPSNSARLLGVGLGSGARVQEAHPLLQGLDLAGLRSESPSVSSVPGWARVVLGSVQGPLVLEGRLEGHPTVALTFDPAISGLEKSLAFPLLLSNATGYLIAQAESPGKVSAEAFDPAESDIRPRVAPAFTSTSTPSATMDSWVDRWPWLAGAALLVLAAEWAVFARRG